MASRQQQTEDQSRRQQHGQASRVTAQDIAHGGRSLGRAAQCRESRDGEPGGDDSVLQAYVKKKNGGAAVLYPSDENAGMTTDSVLKTIRQEYDNALDAAKRREYDKLPAVTSI